MGDIFNWIMSQIPVYAGQYAWCAYIYVGVSAIGSLIVVAEKFIAASSSKADDEALAKIEGSNIGKIIIPALKKFSWVKGISE